MENPFQTLESRLARIENLLLDLAYPRPASENTDDDRYEAGVEVATQILGLQPQTIYQNIRNIPHRKMFGKLYFNRRELRDFLANGGLKGGRNV